MSVAALDEALEADAARRHPPVAGRRVGRHGRHRRDRSARRDRRALPRLWRLVPRRWRLWRPVRALRRGPRPAPRHRAGRQRRARSAQDPVPALRHRRGAGPRRQAAARRLQRQRRLYPAARRVRGRPVARRPVARADPPFPRACACGCRCSLPASLRSAPRRRRSSRSPAISTRACRRSTASIPARRRDLSVVAFRYVPEGGDADEFTERLLQHISAGRPRDAQRHADRRHLLHPLRDPLLPHPSRACRRGDRGHSSTEWRRSMAEIVAETERLRLRDWDRRRTSTSSSDTRTPSRDALARRRPGRARSMRRRFERISGYQRDFGHTFWIVERKSDGALLGFCGLKRVNAPGAPISRRLRDRLAAARRRLGAGLCQGSGDRQPRPRLRPVRRAACRRAHRRPERGARA